MTVTTAKWTLDDYHRMIEVGLISGRQVELLNGEILQMPPEGYLNTRSRVRTHSTTYVLYLGKKHLYGMQSR